MKPATSSGMHTVISQEKRMPLVSMNDREPKPEDCMPKTFQRNGET